MTHDPHALPSPSVEGWHPDPARRHEYRYHDGTRWTHHVADQGQAATDPLPAAPPPAGGGAAAGDPVSGESGPAWVDGAPTHRFPTPQTYPTAPSALAVAEPTPPGGVTFAEAVQRCLRKYADFTGRAPRSEYWWFHLAVLGTNLVASALFESLSPLVALAALLPLLAAAVRRLHDTGRSGATLLLVLIPVVGLIVVIVFLASEGHREPNRYGPPVSH